MMVDVWLAAPRFHCGQSPLQLVQVLSGGSTTMSNSAPAPLAPPFRVLLGPGPSEVSPRVLAAMSLPLLGHLDPAFVALMDETQGLLRQVFRTSNPLTLAVSGTGSAGMEAVVVNLIEPGDRMLVGVNGVFGGRMADVARRAGAEVTTLERPFGEAFDPDEVRAAIQRVRPKVVGIVHAETSTGVRQPLEDIARACREHDVLFAVDTVTSLGGIPVEVDAWGLDAVYSGTQKCLSCPPGLAPVTFGPRAVAAIERRKTPVQSWYLDMTMIMRYWGGDRFYHHTAPISMNYALREALALVVEEGLEARFARHLRNHDALKAGLEALGLSYVPAEGYRLPQLNCVRIPEGVDDVAVRKAMLERWGIEIGGGLGALKGKAWRIGLMGYSSRPANVTLVLGALETCLREQGIGVDPGAALSAAGEVSGQRIDG
jgi:alanine-glyoxylate transaminase/serine-glyoxylate transaminase/serine-pyruvate transaminase